jgi:hypothetical protein
VLNQFYEFGNHLAHYDHRAPVMCSNTLRRLPSGLAAAPATGSAGRSPPVIGC